MDKSLKGIFDLIIEVLIILALAWFIWTFIGQKTHVVGQSMEATLYNGDQVIIEKVSYYFSDPKRFDIVVFPYKQYPKNHYIKRIIGLPGETIDFKDGFIYINGEKLEESYGKEMILGTGNISLPFTIPDDEYFLMGDNRNNSSDSRFADVGTMSKKDFTGKAWLRVWPFSEFGIVK